MEKKVAYFEKLVKLIDEYPKMLIFEADNVGSNHMQTIRKSLRGEAVMVMGKNTMMRRAIRHQQDKDPRVSGLLPYMKGNVGLVFTKGELSSVRDKLTSLRVAAPAKAGALAPIDVTINAGNTGMEPTKTSFFQALNIPSKIVKGSIEILSDVLLIKAGTKVGSSEAALLQMLNVKPFFYSLQVKTVYEDGNIYSAKVLDITDDDIVEHFGEGVAQVAALSLGTGIPSLAAFPHVVINSYKNLVAIAAETDITFKQVEKLKEMLANPEAFQAAAAPVATQAAPAAATTSAPVEEEEEEVEMLDLFG